MLLLCLLGADIGTHVYHEKTAATEGLLNASRKEWAQGEGWVWIGRGVGMG